MNRKEGLSDSSSSEDEDLEQFRQAVDTSFTTERVNKSRISITLVLLQMQMQQYDFDIELKQIVEKLILTKILISAPSESQDSLRSRKDEDEQFNDLDVTPQFRKHVADKLSEIIERRLTKQIRHVYDDEPVLKSETESGIRLFRESRVHLKTDVDDIPTVKAKKPKIQRRNCEDAIVRESERIKEAAVDPEKVLSQDEVKFWAKTNTKPHFRYRKDENGQFSLVEPKFQ